MWSAGRGYLYVVEAVHEDRASLALAIKFSINETTLTADELWPRILGAVASLHGAQRAFYEQESEDETCPEVRG